MSFFNNNGKNDGSSNGGGVADEIAWNKVIEKPTKFPPEEHDHDERYSGINHNHDGQYSNIEHNHDERYNTKEEVQTHINYVTDLMAQEQGKIATHADDELGYLSTKIDNVTVGIRGSEVYVKNIEGLTVGTSDISEWLAGTNGNIQTQIDEISDNITVFTSGMEYRGKLENYAELQAITNMENGDLFVVLADENRTGGRSMYVYSEHFGMWEFIGEFTFTDSFLALKDTPASYTGDDGKVAKVAGERLVFGDVDYGDLTNKPSSTITQIDDAVTKKHEHINGDLLDTYNQTNANLQTAVNQSHTHSNKSAIDRIGINASGQLTIDGVVYAPKNEPTEKKFLSAYLKNTQTIARGDFIKFDTIKGGSTIPYDINTGIFTLEVGKTYRVTVSVMGEIREWITIQYANEQKTNWAHPYSAVYGASSNVSARGSSGVLDTTFTVSNRTNVGILISETHDSDNPVRLFSNRTMLVVQEL